MTYIEAHPLIAFWMMLCLVMLVFESGRPRR